MRLFKTLSYSNLKEFIISKCMNLMRLQSFVFYNDSICFVGLVLSEADIQLLLKSKKI
jgi:hypothetical protein